MTCEYEDCEKPATDLAIGREYLDMKGHPNRGRYCQYHAQIVADEGFPEYVCKCPNCGCLFGKG